MLVQKSQDGTVPYRMALRIKILPSSLFDKIAFFDSARPSHDLKLDTRFGKSHVEKKPRQQNFDS